MTVSEQLSALKRHKTRLMEEKAELESAAIQLEKRAIYSFWLTYFFGWPVGLTTLKMRIRFYEEEIQSVNRLIISLSKSLTDVKEV